MKKIAIDCVGYSIEADLYEGSSDKVILVLHGWLSNKSYQEAMTNFLVAETGASAVVIEFSGHGGSKMDVLEIRPAQHFLEVIAAFDWIKKSYPNAEVSVLGTSYGGYMAANLAKYRDFNNLILRVPAIYKPLDFYSLNKYLHDENQRVYRKNKDFLNSHTLFISPNCFKGRTLVVWHELDEHVPKETTDKYIDYFIADSYLARGWKHAFKIDAPIAEQKAYQGVISDWLSK